MLAEGYDFIVTSRFQRDPLEMQFGQYQQMSGGRFLVRLRQAALSEKIIKLRALLKNDIDISNIMDSNVEHDENIETLLHHVDLSRCSDEMVTLSEDSREVLALETLISKATGTIFSEIQCSSGSSYWEVYLKKRASKFFAKIDGKTSVLELSFFNKVAS